MHKHENIKVIKSKIQGKGIIATRNFKKNELVCVMTGTKISITKLRKNQAKHKVRIDDPLEISWTRYVLLDKPYIYINHSCNPNLFAYRSRRMKAIRDIKQGEEITYDYSSVEWSNDKLWKINWTKLWRMECHCGQKNCRKLIRTFPNLPMKTKMYYYNNRFLPDYIINKLKRR
jgi:uncharacterized protein